MLERAHHRCAHRHHVPAAFLGALNRPRGYFGNAIRFVQRKQAVKFFIAGGRYTGGVSDCFKLDLVFSQLRQHMPIKGEACRWWFECYGWSGNPRPNIPEREWLLKMSVLDRSTVMGQSRPHLIGGVGEAEQHQTWVANQFLNRRAQWSKNN